MKHRLLAKYTYFISTPKAPSATKYENVHSDKLVYTILCKPFVVRANPKTGKCSPFTTEIHVIGAAEKIMAYRKTLVCKRRLRYLD